MSDPKPHNTYLSGYAPKATVHHEWRTASNSAPHLLPTLRSLAATTPALALLDVGAGSGTITASFAAEMPPGGHIVATDISDEILEKAARYAEEAGVGGMVRTRRANVYELPFAEGSFDVVHASQVLAHLDEPGRAVAEMARVAKKPGGVVALRESDLRAWSIYPEYPGLLAMNKVLCAVHEANGANANAGTHLVSWALAAGVEREKIHAGAGTWCYSTREERALWGATMADRCVNGAVPKRALELGLATEEGLREMEGAWKKWVDAEDGWFGCLHGEVLIQF